MAWVKVRQRASGPQFAVLFRVDHRQTSVTYGDQASADRFCALVNAVGGKRAMEIEGVQDTVLRHPDGKTLGTYLREHLASRTGLEKKTLSEYKRYIERDLAPLADIPLRELNRTDVADWVNGLTGSGKTIANKHGFLSGALKQAVKDGEIPANPCEGMKLPRTETLEATFLTPEEYRLLRDCFSAFYRPLVEFLVASGARFSEAAALKPADIDWTHGTVNIRRSWKRIPAAGWELGAPKSKRSVRTITVPVDVLENLDRSHEWVFANKAGNPVRVYGFRENVWYPTVRKAQAQGLEKKPRIHDLRHTCASWMIHAGVPLPVIQRHLGHESIKTTIDLYGHLDQRSARSAAAAIASALGT